MATQVIKQTKPAAEPAVIMRAVTAPATAASCGECIYHIPHATRPDGWCACKGSALRWQTVDPGRATCGDFAIWPEGSPVPAFLAAMRF